MEIISMKFKLDDKDSAILELLQKDSSKTKKQLARRLGLPLTTVHNRIARLQAQGVIIGYRARVDQKKLGYDVSAFIHITVDYKTPNYSQEQTARRIRLLPGVESVAIVAGASDIIAKVRCRATADLNDFLLHHLRKMPGIDKTTTIVVLQELD